MKKMVLGLSLSLAALAFLVSPAMAAPTLSVADQAFLASLAKAPAGIPAPELAARRPAIGLKDTCTANCAGGGTVTCSGGGSCTAVDGSCPSEPGHVVCGGITKSCSPCPVPVCQPPWCTQDCDSQCPCGGTLICNTNPCTSHCQCKLHCPV